MTTCKDENGATSYLKQPQHEVSSYCLSATSSKAAQARTVLHVQATHQPSRCCIAHLQALSTFLQ
eukprot:2391511-Ditylum_brightwellii.AAC.1